mmetsp:Transcript_14010/g.39914  ORF Transcript_14010/g.39914 Transcript_14010/m.39914 type:complete len:239 (-) Transcript_14010:401-1117(-)
MAVTAIPVSSSSSTIVIASSAVSLIGLADATPAVSRYSARRFIRRRSGHGHLTQRHGFSVAVFRKRDDEPRVLRSLLLTRMMTIRIQNAINDCIVPPNRIFGVPVQGHDLRSQLSEMLHDLGIANVLFCTLGHLFGLQNLDLDVPFGLQRKSRQHRPVVLPAEEQRAHEVANGRLLGRFGIGNHADWFVVVEIGLDPSPDMRRLTCISQIQKPNSPNVRRVHMFQEQLHLLLGASQRE